MRNVLIIILTLTILLSLGCLEAKKSKKTTPEPQEQEQVIEQKPVLQQAQEKAIEAEKLNTEGKIVNSAETFEEALGLFEQAAKEPNLEDSTKVSIQQSIENMYKNLSIVEEKAGDYPKTLFYIDKRLETDSLNTILIFRKYTIMKDNMMDQAGGIKVLEQFATRHENYDFYLNIADFYVATRNIPTAIEWYTKADAIKKNPVVTYNLGKYNKDVKNIAASTKYFEEYLTMQPKPEELNPIYKALGSNYKSLGNNQKAIFYFEKSLAIEQDPKISLALFDLYYKAKNDKMTIKYANQVLLADPTNTDVTFVRGMSKYNLKDMVGAKADFEKVANDPKYAKYAKQYLDSMK